VRGSVGASAEIQKIAELDYGNALRQCLARSEVQEIIREGKRTVWPNLNHRPHEVFPPEEFARKWSKFGVEIQFSRFAQENRLLGFYTKETFGMRRRPLIWVNTAHHPAVVAVAIDHEMGHHLTAQMFAAERGLAQLSHFGFQEHLIDQAELSADLLVSTVIYPVRAASLLLTNGGPRGAKKAREELGCVTVPEFIASQYGFSVGAISKPAEKLQALATLLHYTKLRQALFEEYNI
jgi:hypothetical protein